MSIFANIAEISAERMEELAGQASLRDSGITAGIATDKLLAPLWRPFPPPKPATPLPPLLVNRHRTSVQRSSLLAPEQNTPSFSRTHR